MIRRFIKVLLLVVLAGALVPAQAQVDSVVGQISSSVSGSFVGGISGNGRFVVFESRGDVATVNPRNSDGNREIFLFDYAQRRIFQITDTKVVINGLSGAASGTVTLNSGTSGSVSSITVDGVEVLSGSVPFNTSLEQTATDIANNINNFTSSPDYTATVDGATVTITATTPGTASNGLAVVTTADGINTTSTSFTGGFNSGGPVTASNTRVEILNTRPVISNDGRWIAFSSNATTSTPAAPDATNPGSFDGNDYTDVENNNPLTEDANLEMWLYHVPAASDADLTLGIELPFVDLSAGTFTRVTNTAASRLPVAGSATQTPLVASDNTDPSISDDGNVLAFVSNRNLVGTGNQAPEDNPEIFTYVRSGDTLSQVTMTPRGEIFAPISNNVPTISGNGMRVMFASNADNPVVGMTGGDNTDLNEEVFYADLNASGAPSGNNKQVTVTSPTNEGEIVNLINFGRRMSRDGNYIAFDSHADLTNENSGENQLGFATFLYDVGADTITRIGPRSDADSAATGGDVARYPGFTDYDGSGVPHTLILETRMNIAPDGTIPTNEEDGLNPDVARPAQIYTYPLGGAALSLKRTSARLGAGTFTRISKFPSPFSLLASTQPMPSDTSKRVAFTISQSELGLGNPDLSAEVYYLLQPHESSETASTLSFSTGATAMPVQNDPVTEPSPTPTPSPSPSPSPGETPTPTPEPTSPPAFQGISKGMLAMVDFQTGINQPVVARTAVGSLDRSFQLPMELAGVTMSINGATVGLKRVSQRQIIFVAPKGISEDLNNPYPVVINNNGVVIRGAITFVASRPDIFRTDTNPELNRAKIFNITNRVFTREPFTATTLKYRGGVKVPTKLRLYATGVEGIVGSLITIRIGEVGVTGDISNATPVAPGIYTVDFELGNDFDMLGDQGILMLVLSGGNIYQSRLQGDAPRLKIL